MPQLQFKDWRAGLWTAPGDVNSAFQQPGFAAPPNGLLKADNLEYLDSGAIRGRRGYVLYDTQPLPGQIVGSYRHYPRNGPQESGDAVCLGQNESSLGGTAWDVSTLGFIGQRDGFPCQTPLPMLTDELTQVLKIPNPYRGAREIMDVGAVTGIKVDIHRRSVPNAPGGAGMYDVIVQFFNRATMAFVGENKAKLLNSWPGEYGTAEYGGPGDRWEKLGGWTVGELNSADLELWIQVQSKLDFQQPQIDFVDIHVYIATDLDPTFIVSPRVSDKVRYYRPTVDGGGAGWTRLQIREETDVPGDPPAPVDYEPVFETLYRPRFVSWLSQNRTYIWDGANRVVVFDGEYLQPGPSAAPRGPYAALWKARLWATDPNELNFSVYASGVNDPDGWDIGRSQLSIPDTRGGVITGLIDQDDRLLMFKDSGLWSFIGDIDTGGQLREYTTFGCVAPESIARSEYGIFYVGAEGLYLTDGESRQPLEISRPVRSLFIGRSAETLYRGACCWYYPLKRQLFVKLDPTATEGYVVHILQGEDGPLFAWSKIPVAPWQAGTAFAYSPDDGELVTGSSTGFVRLLDNGTVDRNDANVAFPITVAVQTPSIRMAATDVTGRATHLKTIARHRAVISATMAYDVDESAAFFVGALGLADLAAAEYQHSRAFVRSLDKFGHYVGVELSNTGDAAEFELHEIQIRTALRTARRWVP